MDEFDPQKTFARFKAFWITVGAIIACALLGVFVRWAGAPEARVDAEAEERRLVSLGESREAQQKAVEALGLTYHPPEGGHLPRVSAPDPLLASAVARLRQSPGHKTEQLVPGSKTFLEKQAATHDPVESEFLKK